jgi:[acyl-carrier-protein] S-malonyltransferase
MKIAYIFPGQGSQFIGMGKSLFEDNQDFFQEHLKVIQDICGKNFLSLMFEGSIEELSLTYNTQPALFISSVFVIDLLKNKKKFADYVAGHSLGEYSALYSAGVFDFSTGLNLIKHRGEMMNKAVPAGVGTMAAIIGSSPEEIQKIVSQKGVEVANYNNASQTIISGKKEKVLICLDLLKSAGAKKVIELNVSGPFHSSLMKSMADDFSEIINNAQFHDAQIPVITNIDASETINKDDFKKKLLQQLYSSVYWMQTIEKLHSFGVTNFVECGAGQVLSGISKRIVKDCNFISIDKSDDLLEYINN